MCFHFIIASPLTLSELRSMLPPGLTADLLEPGEQRLFREAWPDVNTAARVMHGACSCDLVVERHPVGREDEAWLRRRYRQLHLSRSEIIAALETHRRAAERHRRPAGHWPGAAADFVAEHARNAGPSVYLLHFAHDGRLTALPDVPVRRLPVAAVRANPGGWLPEGVPVVVEPDPPARDRGPLGSRLR